MKFGKIDIAGKMTRTIGLVGGGIGAAAMNNKLLPMVLKDKADPLLSNGITAAAGVFLPEIAGMILGKSLKGKKGQSTRNFVQAVGDGMVASAGVNLVGHFAPSFVSGITGISGGAYDIPYEEEYLVQGFDQEYNFAVSGPALYENEGTGLDYEEYVSGA